MQAIRFILIALVGFGSLAGATPSGSIIQISHKLKMTAEEPLPEKDFYIDLGSRDGVKVGDSFDIFRKLTVTNVPSGGAVDLFKLPFGELKVYLVGDSASVAHITRTPEFKDLPVVDYANVMLGDDVRLKSSLPFQPAAP